MIRDCFIIGDSSPTPNPSPLIGRRRSSRSLESNAWLIIECAGRVKSYPEGQKRMGNGNTRRSPAYMRELNGLSALVNDQSAHTSPSIEYLPRKRCKRWQWSGTGAERNGHAFAQKRRARISHLAWCSDPFELVQTFLVQLICFFFGSSELTPYCAGTNYKIIQ